jgi:predicted nucleotidyltransferase
VTRIRIVPSSDAEAALWRTAAEVAGLFGTWPWIIIGAQMIMLLEHEHGRPSGRTTGDLDVIVDVRVVVDGMLQAAERLRQAGFEPSAEHPYRFVRGRDQVDLLAPDHLGPRADLATVPPLTMTQIPGGSRALATRRLIPVDIVSVGTAELPVPSIPGAIVLKLRAHQARVERRDVEDLVRLLALVNDVEMVRAELKTSERRGLGAITALGDETNAAWDVVPDPDDARAAFGRLVD